MEHNQRVINYYDATHIDYRALWAGSADRAVHFGYYDEVATNHRAALLRINEVLAESVHIRRSDNVLDSGCGYGGTAMWLAERFNCTVTGITITPLHASKAQRYVTERKLADKVRVIEGDYATLPFPDASFDVYWAHESLVHAENLKAVLIEAARVLKPNGRLMIAEYTLRENPELSISEKNLIQPWLTGWAMPKLLTPREYRKELQDVGLIDVAIHQVTSHIRPSIRRLEILSILNYPIALFIAPFFFRPERLENYYGAWRQIRAFKKGIWNYSILTARKPLGET